MVLYSSFMPRSIQNAAAVRRERARLVAELSELTDLIRGSFFERYSTCMRPTCACHEGQRHGPRGYVTVTAGGRKRQYYVPQNQTEAVRHGIQQYQRLMGIVDRISSINLQLMQGGTLNEPDP
jgi:uncharacterized protein DUF6788